jgi:tetratricopeptide (TPR) repeat protein
MDYDRLRELQEKFEENPRRYFAPLANEYRKGGQPKRAIEICRAQLSQMPGHMSGQIVYGQSLYDAGEFDEARQVFERALTLDPENLIGLRTLGDMALQSGDTVEARKWYMRLLDADPKDTAVIALVSEINASAKAAPIPTPEIIPSVDTAVGDQEIQFVTDDAGAPVSAENAPPAPLAAAEPLVAAETAPPPEPVEASAPSERASLEAPIAATTPESPPAPVSVAAPPAGLERHYPVEPAEPIVPDLPLGAKGLRATVRADEVTGAEGLRGTAPESPEPVGTEGLKGKAPTLPLAGAKASRSDDEEALDTWTPPPAVTGPERVESPKEDRIFSGPGPEPFVNETMAQLYLQQGYRQLALRVYYQLAEARPEDKALRDRITQIEAEDRAAHPESPPVPQTEARPTERPSREPAAPRQPSVAAPIPRAAPVSEEGPSYDRSPVDSPPLSEPARRRESVEAPVRQEPRAEPHGVAARQPSIREFFATLGRRRPPRSQGNPGGGARSGNNMPADAGPSLGASPPSASLDQVFAGATVSPSDSRAASRLAGAFSGTGGTSRTPPTPPMPTPRVNTRIAQTQESEEDVAKFRAWLDGLTGE